MPTDFRGRTLPVAPPEDLIVMKAIASGEDTPRYWYGLASSRTAGSSTGNTCSAAPVGTGRAASLSLPLYPQSNDQVVPSEVIADLYDAIMRGAPTPAPESAVDSRFDSCRRPRLELANPRLRTRRPRGEQRPHVLDREAPVAVGA